LNSEEQIKDLTTNIEQLRRQRAEILAQQQQATTRLKELSTNLKLSAGQATDAFRLQTDQIFQQNLKNYSEASAALVVLESKFLPNHPH
jgi:phage shock protein A